MAYSKLRVIIIPVIIPIIVAIGATACQPAQNPVATATATPPSEDAAVEVLQQAAQLVCPFSGPGKPRVPEIQGHDGSYYFVCIAAAGHETTVRIKQFADQSEAQAAFNSARGDNPVQDFYGAPLSVWQEQYPSFPDGRYEYRISAWQVDRYFIYVRAFDDTHFLTAPDPQTVSETIYQVAIDLALFPGPK